MALTEVLQIRLSPEHKAKIMRLAAQRALATGERISAGDVLRTLALQALNEAEATTAPEESMPLRDPATVQITLHPEIAKALRRAGSRAEDVINQALAQAFEMEVRA